VIRKLGQDKTVLFSSHILQEVEAICDRVVIINKGKLVADDKLSRLRQQNNSGTVRIAFKEELDAELLQKLKAVKGISRLERENGNC